MRLVQIHAISEPAAGWINPDYVSVVYRSTITGLTHVEIGGSTGHYWKSRLSVEDVVRRLTSGEAGRPITRSEDIELDRAEREREEDDVTHLEKLRKAIESGGNPINYCWLAYIINEEIREDETSGRHDIATEKRQELGRLGFSFDQTPADAGKAAGT